MTSARVEEARRRKQQQLGRLHAAYNVARNDLRSKARLAGLVHVHGMWGTYRAVLGRELWRDLKVITPPELRSKLIVLVGRNGETRRTRELTKNGPIERWLPGWVVLTIEAWRQRSSLVGDARSIRKFIRVVWRDKASGLPAAISAAQELDGLRAVVELIGGVGGFG